MNLKSLLAPLGVALLAMSGAAHALISEGVEYTASFTATANPSIYNLTVTIDADQNTFGAYSLQAVSFYATSIPGSENSVMTSFNGGSAAAWGAPKEGDLPDGNAGDCKDGSGAGTCWDTTNAGLAPVSGLMTFQFAVTGGAGSSFLLGTGPHLKVSWFDDANGTLLTGHHLSLNVGGTTPPVPEPSTYALMLAGLGVVGFVARRRRSS